METKFKEWLLLFENDANKKIIYDAFNREINQSDPSILGYHGTSLHALQHAVEHGFFPITAGTEKTYGGEGDTSVAAYGPNYQNYGFHIMPNMKNKIAQNIQFRNEPSGNPFDTASDFAKLIGKRHSFFDKYNLDLSNPKHHEIAMELEWDGISHKDIEKKYSLPKPSKQFRQGGVVLAISDKVANHYKLLMGGDGDDINIVTRQLPIQFVVGIEPVDDAAFDWLSSLQ